MSDIYGASYCHWSPALIAAGKVRLATVAATGSAVGESEAQAITVPVQWCRFRYAIGDEVYVNGQEGNQRWVVANFYHIRTNRYVVYKNGWFCERDESELCTQLDYFSQLEAVTEKLGRLPPRSPPANCVGGG